jgi:uncharacterized protein YkwD
MPDNLSLRHLLFTVFAIGTLMLVALGGAKPAQALSNCDVADMTFDAEEQAFLGVINDYRAANGLQPLTISVNLNRAAEWKALDLGTHLIFSHTDSLGRGPQQRIADCGGAPWFGENLAAGTVISTAQSAFSLWRSSSGHNKNMLLADYKQIGIARYYAPNSRYTWYWVTEFSVTDDGTGALPGLGIVSPTPSTALTGSTATFEWTGTGDEFWVTVGTTPGGYDVYSSSLGLAHKVTINNLPTYSPTIYVRLWTRVAGIWHFTDYSYAESG